MGQHILSGQQESGTGWGGGGSSREMNLISKATGRLPAIRGLDFMSNDFDGVVKRAIDWWEDGGIVTICYHWGTPPDGLGYESSKGQIDLTEALTEGTELYAGLLAQMDEAAVYLGQLRDAGVPVLWRPFHEFGGAWFWWGKGGAANFKKLWQLMYDRYTQEFGLDNLIWVLGYSGEDSHDWKAWYPGDQYVDIAGSDTYGSPLHQNAYKKLTGFIRADMPLALHENGHIPDPDQLWQKKLYWSWFMTWHTEYIEKKYNPEDYLKKIYEHELVITLDELPSF
jgi:mannan endo-1,4-beta-mannosidase